MWPSDKRADVEPPATDADIEKFLTSISKPLPKKEVNRLLKEHKRTMKSMGMDPLPTYDPANWTFPEGPFPEEYLAFLKYSNGGYFEGRYRDFDPLFDVGEVREYLEAYQIPQWMPGACPIGFDGGGTFYLLDLRDKTKTPVLFSHAGNLGYDDAGVLAQSFSELIETGLGPEFDY